MWWLLFLVVRFAAWSWRKNAVKKEFGEEERREVLCFEVDPGPTTDGPRPVQDSNYWISLF